jgi:hypothetical protein
VKQDKSLLEQFNKNLGDKFDYLDDMKEIVISIYTEFTRKLYNTRLAEFVDCYRQAQAAEKGSATLSGQTQHTNLKSMDIRQDI